MERKLLLFTTILRMVKNLFRTLEALSEKHKFELSLLPVDHPWPRTEVSVASNKKGKT